jgi:hypothetical protein
MMLQVLRRSSNCRLLGEKPTFDRGDATSHFDPDADIGGMRVQLFAGAET